MNMLRKTTSLRQFLRFAETLSARTTPIFNAERLNKRDIIRVQGDEVVPFLQGLITNDMKHLERNGSMFTMFLNNSGKVLYDAIIYRTLGDDTFLIECDQELSTELRRHLRLYRVRRKIDIDCISSDFSAWAVYNPVEGGELPKPREDKLKLKISEMIYTPDPRVKELGVRLIQPRSINVKDFANLFPNGIVEESTSSDYDAHRYMYGVGEGVNEHPPGKSFPLEANCDFLHGVSFHKGCYVGQELTARVYHTGVIRKRLMPLKLSSDIDDDINTVQTQAGTVVGNIRGVSKRRALALLRVDSALKSQELMIDGDPCSTYKPNWWPQQLPTRQFLRNE